MNSFSVEKHCLVYWPTEESVSVVTSGDLYTDSSVGEECKIRIGRRCFVGIVSATGKCIHKTLSQHNIKRV